MFVGFNGSGDSGSIDSIDYDHGTVKPDQDVTVDCLCYERALEDGQWIRVPATRTLSLNEAIDELTYNYLEYADIDWYNDEGGFGELIINVDEGTVSLEVEVRYTNSSCEFLETLDIETGEAI